MRWLGLPLLAVLLGGCSSLAGTAANTLRTAVTGGPDVHYSRNEIFARPYAQMRLDSNGGTRLLVLGHVEHGDTLWYGPDDGLFVQRHGLLVKTVHQAVNLDGTAMAADSPLRVGLQHLTTAVTVTRHVDISPGYRYGVPVTAHFVPAGMETLTILGTPHRLRRIDVTLDAPALHFSAHNHYWVDPADGLIWKSEQTVPGGATYTFTQLRPYREPAR